MKIYSPIGTELLDIVAGIVKDRYPYDKMEAVLMNYLNTDSEKREQHISEYNEMQEWRAKAKEIAKQVSF
jgi:L-lactate utilization protein LutB